MIVMRITIRGKENPFSIKNKIEVCGFVNLLYVEINYNEKIQRNILPTGGNPKKKTSCLLQYTRMP